MSIVNFRNFNMVSSWKPTFRCAVCKINTLSISQHHRPYILDCFHDVCEKCVISLKPSFILTCKICLFRTRIDSAQSIREQLEPNFYLRGFFGYAQNVMMFDIERLQPKDECIYPDYNVMSILNESENNYECDECTLRKTNYYCVQCNVPLCRDCYENIHKIGKALKKHNFVKMKPKGILNDKKNPQVCEKHKKICENFCKSCQKITCKDCIPINHSQHQHRVISLLDENLKHLKELNNVMEMVHIAKKDYQKIIKFYFLLENWELGFSNYVNSTSENRKRGGF